MTGQSMHTGTAKLQIGLPLLKGWCMRVQMSQKCGQRREARSYIYSNNNYGVRANYN